jgi:hypothetical protein
MNKTQGMMTKLMQWRGNFPTLKRRLVFWPRPPIRAYIGESGMKRLEKSKPPVTGPTIGDKEAAVSGIKLFPQLSDIAFSVSYRRSPARSRAGSASKCVPSDWRTVAGFLLRAANPNFAAPHGRFAARCFRAGPI